MFAVCHEITSEQSQVFSTCSISCVQSYLLTRVIPIPFRPMRKRSLRERLVTTGADVANYIICVPTLGFQKLQKIGVRIFPEEWNLTK